MTQSLSATIIDERIEELEAELAGVHARLVRIDQSLDDMEQQLARDPEFAASAAYIDRMTVECSRKRMAERRREDIENEIATLREIERNRATRSA